MLTAPGRTPVKDFESALLCRLSADTLKLGLGLLGIPSLERM